MNEKSAMNAMLDTLRADLRMELEEKFPEMDESESLILGTVLMSLSYEYIKKSGRDPIEYAGKTVDRIRMERSLV